ncbi:MAG TPA: hypothetical protein V6D17_19645, partial [Candidatus Obscuribacterales bacterium]
MKLSHPNISKCAYGAAPPKTIALAALPLMMMVLTIWPCFSLTTTMPPPDNLIVSAVPPIPQSIADHADRYIHFRQAFLTDWHPLRREILINTRFADTSQVHRVSFPGGDRQQLTFYQDRVAGGSFQPTQGKYFVFAKDRGGDEFFQKYRFDPLTKEAHLLTDGKSRNTGGAWSNKGDLLAYNSSRRNGKDNDVYVVAPQKPETDKCLVQLTGEGWDVCDWSPDDRTILLSETISANESYLWLLSRASGKIVPLTPRNAKEISSYREAVFSRDGRGVYATTDSASEFRVLTYIDLQSGQQKALSGKIKWDVE